MRGDLKSVADRANVREDVKRAGRADDTEAIDSLEASQSRSTLLRNRSM